MQIQPSSRRVGQLRDARARETERGQERSAPVLLVWRQAALPVFPVPALPTTTATPSPARQRCSTIACCSPDSVGRDATASATSAALVTPAPASLD